MVDGRVRVEVDNDICILFQSERLVLGLLKLVT